MSQWAKISVFTAFLIVIAVFAASFMTQGWLNLFTVFMFVAGGLIVFAIALDYKMYLEFFTMRTTKHGMNMGAAILVVLVLAVCVNYLANLHNKSWDFTQEKLNSLSQESMNVMKNLKGDMEIKIFTKDTTPPEEKQKLKQSLALYTDYSGKVKVHFINSYVENSLAMEYLNGLSDRDSQALFVFVEYGGKKIRAELPFDEAAITSAMIKATRSGDSKIYFIKGHGEKEIDQDGEQGLKEFAHALTESSFKVESLNLIDKKEIPKDAAALAIIGPRVPFLEGELKQLHQFAADGGRIFIALDPGQRSNLSALVKSMGIEFENNYIFTLTPLAGGGPALILGRTFDPASEITRNFATGANYALFFLTSEVKPASDKASGIQVQELVKTDASAFTLTDVTQKLTKRPDTRPVTLAAGSFGKIEESAPKEFTTVVFGDSDFLSNHSLNAGVNRDLAMNSFAALTNQKDLLSIRPKLPKGTAMMLTGTQRALIVLLAMALPIVLLLTSGVIWFRRRGA